MRSISTLVVIVLTAAACAEPAPPAAAPPPTTVPVTTSSTPATTSTTSTTTTTTAPAFTRDDARALYDELTAETGWTIPPVAEEDFAMDLCSRPGEFDSYLYQYAETLLIDPYLGWDAQLTDENLLTAAQIGWALGASLCPEGMAPPGELPTALPEPQCDLSVFRPMALPWTDDVPEADQSTVVSGVAGLAWNGPEGARYEITLGRTPDHTTEPAAGTVEGREAAVLADEAGVTVSWERSPAFCDAWSVRIAPAPDVADVSAYVDELTIWRPTPNAAEQRMSAALERLSGYRDGGGEPSHGGQSAVYALETGDGALIALYAVPHDLVGEYDLVPGEPRGTDTIAGVEVTFELKTEDWDAGWHRAHFDDSEFFVSVVTDGGLDTLITFMEAWVPAWLG